MATKQQVLDAVRTLEVANAGSIAKRCGASPAEVARHLSGLVDAGIIKKEARGGVVLYHVPKA